LYVRIRLSLQVGAQLLGFFFVRILLSLQVGTDSVGRLVAAAATSFSHDYGD
jgi:hypothetical protein